MNTYGDGVLKAIALALLARMLEEQDPQAHEFFERFAGSVIGEP